MTIEARLTFATQLILEAGQLAARHFAHRETLTRESKGPQDFVSIADREDVDFFATPFRGRDQRIAKRRRPTLDEADIRSISSMDLLGKSGEFPVSNEELDETATTVYKGI
jgi:hypothetical protein